MRGEKKIRAALPYLTARELWFIECDCHRVANAAAIGGASGAQWQQYVTLEDDIAKERKQRFPESVCPFPRACVDGWTDKELIELDEVHNKINRGTFAARKAQKRHIVEWKCKDGEIVSRTFPDLARARGFVKDFRRAARRCIDEDGSLAAAIKSITIYEATLKPVEI